MPLPPSPSTLISNFSVKSLAVDVAIGDVAVAARIGRRGFADDRAVLDAPELRVAVPSLQAHAVEERDIALVIVEVDGARLGERHAAAATGRRGR